MRDSSRLGQDRSTRMRTRALRSMLAIACIGLGLAQVIGSDGRDPAPESEIGRRVESGASLDAPDRSLLGQARSQIAAREYRASETEQGLQAPNREQNLRSYFEPTGVRVHDRTAAGSPKLVGIELDAIGRGASLSAVAPGEVRSADRRVEIRRAGVVEWFENTEAGLEQGFTLERRPGADSPAGARFRSRDELVLDLRVTSAKARPNGDAVALETASGRILSYEKLEVLDARGLRLAARFEVPSADRIRLVVDDREAVYPVVIDPLLTNVVDRRLDTQQLGALGGSSVASAGDFDGDGIPDLLIGAPLYDNGALDEGAAFVFLGSPNAFPSEAPIDAHALFESDLAGARFGSSVASVGDVDGDGRSEVIVGASQYSDKEASEGAAFIFLGSATPIANGNPASADARFESNQANAQLGSSVASAGDVNGDGHPDVIVGSEGYSSLLSNVGAAFVFLGSATGFDNGTPATAHAQLVSDQPNSRFGRVAPAGDVNGDGFDDVLVGARLYDAPEGDEGVAFVFLGSATGIASGDPSTAHAQFESDQASALLGIDVASVGDTNGDGYGDVLVGASGFNGARGAAFLFLGSAAGFVDGSPATADSTFETNIVGSAFGESVASAGDMNGDGHGDIVIGAPTFSATTGGSAFVFQGSATGVSSGTTANAFLKLTQESTAGVGDRFGHQVAGAGDLNDDGFDDLLVGMPGYDFGPAGDHGAAFVYYGEPRRFRSGEPASIAEVAIDLGLSTYTSGLSASSAGDVNGDGFGDILVGVPDYDAGETGEGAVFVFLGSASVPPVWVPGSALVVLEGNDVAASFGSAVASAGDVNGDGYGDILVGAPDWGASGQEEGAAFLFLGSATGVVGAGADTAHARFESDQIGARMGASVDTAGDVNGDGWADIVVGAPAFAADPPAILTQGRAFVFLGSPIGMADGHPGSADAVLFTESFGLGFDFGKHVASAGDLDGDGYGDLVVGGQSGSEIFSGSAAGIPSGSGVTVSGGVVRPAGDVNGDGFGDVAYIVPPSFVSPDEIRFHHGSSTGVSFGTGPNATIPGAVVAAGSRVFDGFAGLGDVTGDAIDDVAIGTSLVESAGLTAIHLEDPTAGVLPGTPIGVPGGAPPRYYAEFQQPSIPVVSSELAMLRVVSAGDVNGDGSADLLIVNRVTGQAHVLLAAANAPTVVPTQRRGDGSGKRVQPGGRSESETSFEVSLVASHPEGLGRVRIQVETCPQAIAFGAPGCLVTSSPQWEAVSAASPEVEITTLIPGLVDETVYRWRARVMHAPDTGSIPPNPEHGPWLRVAGNLGGGDIRIVPEPGGAGWIFGIWAAAALARRHGRARRNRDGIQAAHDRGAK